MQIHHIAGYKFIALTDLDVLRERLVTACEIFTLKGTILLSAEGINIDLAGAAEMLTQFKEFLYKDVRFADIKFHETHSALAPFKQLKVKIKPEIITLGLPEINPVATRAPSVSPQKFKQWLDEKRDMTILDTRNAYEIQFGTFTGAVNLHINDFSEFPAAAEMIDTNKPIVMFCTGGIRCEKAAIQMLNQGYQKVYQLDGGILGYFANTNGEHYAGECFVFDERISLNTKLEDTDTMQCCACQGPVSKEEQQSPSYKFGVSCPRCYTS